MEYYFLKTVEENSRVRVRPLPNQTHEEYGSIDPDLNVAVSFRSNLDKLKLGTVVAVTDLTQCTGFLTVNTATHYIMGTGFVPEEALEQYAQLIKS